MNLEQSEQQMEYLLEELEKLSAGEATEPAIVAELHQAVDSALRSGEAKRDSFAGYLLDLDRKAEAARDAVRDLEARARRFEKRADRLRYYAASVMHKHGLTKLEGALRTMTLIHGRDHVVIDAPELIPDDFVDRVPRVNREAISKALRAKQDVPGAHLEAGPDTVRVYS